MTTKQHPIDAMEMPEPQAQAVEPEVATWVERWYGSGPDLGWWIVCERNHIVHLGAEVLGDGDTVRKIVDAHNSAIAPKDAMLHACVETPPSVKVGAYEIRTRTDGGYWIEHETGEGMQCSAGDLEACIRDFYERNF